MSAIKVCGVLIEQCVGQVGAENNLVLGIKEQQSEVKRLPDQVLCLDTHREFIFELLLEQMEI